MPKKSRYDYLQGQQRDIKCTLLYFQLLPQQVQQDDDEPPQDQGPAEPEAGPGAQPDQDPAQEQGEADEQEASGGEQEEEMEAEEDSEAEEESVEEMEQDEEGSGQDDQDEDLPEDEDDDDYGSLVIIDSDCQTMDEEEAEEEQNDEEPSPGNAPKQDKGGATAERGGPTPSTTVDQIPAIPGPPISPPPGVMDLEAEARKEVIMESHQLHIDRDIIRILR